ncbi:esterase/lipase family protein [Nocardioides sp.]|uniref:esterase/lipase family protein n=1 Tax=Nocardioides sp. TaxID=35761 RepID=UPI003D09F4D6
MLASLSPARRRFVLSIAALTAIAVVVAVALGLRGRDEPVTPVAQDRPGPVLLIPGYGGSTAGLEILAAALRERGRDATVVELAGDGTGDLNEQAQVVEDAVRRVLDRTGAPSVDLVGYSAGGVTLRLWMRDHGGGNVARRVVTLGSPHHGTDVAALALDVAGDRCPVACQQLATDSDLLRSLNAKDESPAGPQWVSIWTTDDQTVVPPDSASLEGALDFTVQSVCPGQVVAHRDLPRTPSVIAMTLAELGAREPAIPTAKVCVSR